MGKKLFVAEKPSVAQEFAKVLKMGGRRGDGFIESDTCIVTWCVGHLVTMSYPEVYNPIYAKWSFDTLPFLPEQFLYEVIPNVKKQFEIVKGLLNRPDVETIFVCTDSGREGEYIYRLVDQMANVQADKKKYRVWIDSQTEDEILRGIREAKPLEEYDNLGASAYLRAKEDYLMGINFSRALSLKYGGWLNDHVEGKKWTSISVGRVMTCVLGMVVTREWEIRKFRKTPFYRVIGKFTVPMTEETEKGNDRQGIFEGEWKVSENSYYNQSPMLYKENGFKKEETAKELIFDLMRPPVPEGIIEKVEKKKEKKYAPLLFNLAELQNLSSKLFKISPDETLQIVQELYEKKLVTYPRTDARVLSRAVASEITKNLKGLQGYEPAMPYLREIAKRKSFLDLEKTRYVDDKKITDHYAIIPTGQGIAALKSLQPIAAKMYEVIVRRFLSIFYPPAEYQKVNVVMAVENSRQDDVYKEYFHAATKVLTDPGFLPVTEYSFTGKRKETALENETGTENENAANAESFRQMLSGLKKGMRLLVSGMTIKEGETSPPKRYNSGSMILAMENAGQLIEDEELRAMIKGSGIGTSATRAEILKKLINISYLNLNKKTQIITPTLKGELVCGIVRYSIPAMLSPKLTASWEKGLGGVSEGEISEKEYMNKLTGFVRLQVGKVRETNTMPQIQSYYRMAIEYYSEKKSKKETK